jgi:hypothetical protein
MNAADLVALLLEAVAPVTDQLPEVRWREAADAERLTVRPAHVAAGCPAAAALDGDQGFTPRPVVVGPAAAGAVLDRLLLGPRDPKRGGGAGDPATAFREVLADPPEHWAWDWATTATREERALLSAAVSRRAAGVARMLQPWPPPDATHAGRRSPWTHPTRPFRLTGGIDVTLGRRDGTHTIVVVLTGDHTGNTRERLAYEAVVEVLTLRRPPAVVRGLLPDAGRAWSVDVDDALLETGIAAAAGGARTALGIGRIDAAGLPRRPSPACRRCAHAVGCPEGEAWLAGPGRRRLGFLPPPGAATGAGATGTRY